MISDSPAAWIGFAAMVALATVAGGSAARVMPWSAEALRAGVDRAFALILAPFLAGAAILAALLALPGGSRTAHLATVAVVLVAAAAAPRALAAGAPRAPRERAPRTPLHALVLVFLLLWVAVLLINTVALPLRQNDALEYMIVGGEIHATGSLQSYPALDPAANASGLYATWTHPPLYVALIDLAFLLQDRADEPGMARLIAPWFLLAAVAGVVALGSLRSRAYGLVAGILLISVPLIFLGADSSLIDALPIAGMTMALMALIGLRRDAPLTAVWVGAALGCALWTHSQAVLFLPLIAGVILGDRGACHWRRACRDGAVAIAVALAIGAWPYVRNTLLMGSPVSDNPAVFALPALDWKGYFLFARGIDHAVAIAQYGLLKGWFCLEAYGLIFWLWSVGAVMALRWIGPSFGERLRHGTAALDPPRRLLWLSLLLTLFYLAGIAASIALGDDIMIRNERYLTVVFSAVSLVAALPLAWLGARLVAAAPRGATMPAARRAAVALLVAATVLIGAGQWAEVGWLFRRRTLPTAEELRAEGASRFDRMLDHYSNTAVVRRIASSTPADAVVLTMHPADMYYARRRMVSYLDPRLCDLYRDPSPERVAATLRDLGVGYIHLSDYLLPPMYNSALQAVAADPRLTRLVCAEGFTQLFALEDSGRVPGAAIDLTPGAVPWTRTLVLQLGGRKLLNSIGLKPDALVGRESTSTNPLFHRNYSVMVANGHGEGLTGDARDSLLKVEADEYAVSMRFTGRGYLRIWLAQFDERGAPIVLPTAERDAPLLMGEIVLSDDAPTNTVIRRFRPDPRARFLRFGVDHVGRSRVEIDRVAVVPLVRKPC